MNTLKLSFSTFGNFSEHITHLKYFQILIYKTLKMLKSTFFTNFPKSSNLFTFKSMGVDQVLSEMFQINPKLTFNVLHILNHDHISKIEKKYLMVQTRPPKKGPFFGGGGITLTVGFAVCLGPKSFPAAHVI